eukprot:322934_1
MAMCNVYNPQYKDIVKFYDVNIRSKMSLYKDKPREKINIERVLKNMKKFFILVEITDVWHRLMLYPQFIRYHLFKNMELFKIFLKYWHAMRAVDFLVPTLPVPVPVPGAEIFGLVERYLKYLLVKYNDISYCFYSMMNHLKKKHLKYKYLGLYISTIQDKIGLQRVVEDSNYLCLLNLIWKKLASKYAQYNMNMSKYVPKNLICLPVDDYDDKSLDDVIRKKLKLGIKCGNFIECQNKGVSVGNNMKLCSNCKMVYYCNKHCQKKHWKYFHRFVCHKIF